MPRMSFIFGASALLGAACLLPACSQTINYYEEPAAPVADAGQGDPALLAQRSGAKNVIILISDGIGFNGWLAADYYEGKAGAQS